MRRLIIATGVALLLGGASAAAAASPAIAEAPVDLAGAYIHDSAGALTAAEETRVRAALDDLFDRSDAKLFVVVVDTFDRAANGPAWADRTAQLSGLGANDLLLAVAVGDRNYAWSVDSGFALSDDRIEKVATDRMIPHLRDDAWAEAIVGFADGLGDALEPGPPWILIGGGVIAAGGLTWVVTPFVRRGLAQRRRRREAAERAEALDQRAGSLLVALDDSIKTSTQELGFAVAQFGEDAVGDFRAALATARQRLTEAFTLRQLLDDDDPETPDEARAMREQIIAHCEEADAALDAQADAFEHLRSLERDAPALVASLGPLQVALGPRIAAAEATLEDLRSRYGDVATTAAEGSVVQAQRLEAFAAAELAQAETDLAAGATGPAAVHVRSAQQAVAQVGELLDAIDALAVSLPATAARLTAAIDDTRGDIAAARALPAEPGDSLQTAIAAAEAALAAAASLPPAEALAGVESANAELDAAVGRRKAEQARKDRARAQLDRVTRTAAEAIESASVYIATRRGVIGEIPRTRLATAEQRLAEARSLAAHDPVRALRRGQDALSSAQRALRIARDEVRGPRRSDADSWHGAAETGGIFSWLSGGSGSSSGWSSSSRSSRSSSSSRSRSSSSRRSSSRSSGSSRRSGGSRSSSSRRSGGGRF